MTFTLTAARLRTYRDVQRELDTIGRGGTLSAQDIQTLKQGHQRRPHPDGITPPPWAGHPDETWYVRGGWTRRTPPGYRADDDTPAEEVAQAALSAMYTHTVMPDYETALVDLVPLTHLPTLMSPPRSRHRAHLLRPFEFHTAGQSRRWHEVGDRQLHYSAGENGRLFCGTWWGDERDADGAFVQVPEAMGRCTSADDVAIARWAAGAARWLVDGTVPTP